MGAASAAAAADPGAPRHSGVPQGRGNSLFGCCRPTCCPSATSTTYVVSQSPYSDYEEPFTEEGSDLALRRQSKDRARTGSKGSGAPRPQPNAKVEKKTKEELEAEAKREREILAKFEKGALAKVAKLKGVEKEGKNDKKKKQKKEKHEV